MSDKSGGDGRSRSTWRIPEVEPGSAWAERRRLAAGLRALIDQCIGADAPADVFAAAADAVERAAGSLGSHPGKTFVEAMADGSYVRNPDLWSDRGALIGQAHPMAPPMALHDEDRTAVGTVIFGAAFEGAPGLVHGGFIAAAIDTVFGHTLMLHDLPSMTGRLTTHYHRPTPLHRELRIEGTLVRSEGRKSEVEGRVLLDGELLAKADGLFIRVGSAEMRRIFDAYRAPT